jgi:hypothetical protein
MRQQVELSQQIVAELQKWGELHNQHQQWKRVELTRMLDSVVVTRKHPDASKE